MAKTHFFLARAARPDGTVFERPYFVYAERDVRQLVMGDGNTVLTIEHKAHGAWWQREVYTADYKSQFLRAILFFTETGISPTESVLRVMTAERNPRKRAEFADAISVIRGGGRFSDAIESTHMFDTTLMLLLRAGELIGISRVVPAIEELMEARSRLRKFVASIISVLGLEVFTAISSVLTIKLYGLPYIAKSFTSSGQMSPAEKAANESVQAKLQLVSLYNDVMLYIAVGVGVALTTAAIVWLSSPTGRERLAKLILLVPGGRALTYHASLADGFGVLARLLSAGVQLTSVLNTLREATKTSIVSHYWTDCARRIQQGMPVGVAMTDTAILVEAEVVALNTHRNSEQLARVARSISERRAHEAQITRLRFVKLSTVAAPV